MARPGRIAVGLAVIALIAWLILDSSQFQRRAAKIDAALGTGTIGFGPDIEDARVKEAIRAILQVLDTKIAFAINESPRRGRLDIYITMPDARHVTGVDFGNAAYDSVLDAIYIDRSFIDHAVYSDLCRRSSFGILGCRDYFPSLDVMFAFVLSHELGHRQLHGVGSGWLAHDHSREEIRVLEAEADDFALGLLKASYLSGVSIKQDSDDVDTLTDAVGLRFPGEEDVGVNDQVWVDLVGSLTITMMLNSFLAAPYSPFYSDPAHPSFVTRAGGMIGAVLKDEDLPAQLHDHFQFFRLLLQRHARVPDTLAAEILVPEPIVDLGFTDTGLVVMTARGRNLYQVPFSRLRTEGIEGKIPVFLPQERLDGPTPHASTEATWPGGWVHAEADVFWPLNEGTILVVDAWGDQAFRLVGPRWENTSFPVDTNKCFDLWRAADPSNLALARICANDDADLFYSLDGDRVLAHRRFDEILTAIRKASRNPNAAVQFLKSGDRQPAIVINEDLVTLPVRGRAPDESDEHFIGVAIIDLTTLQLAKFIHLQLPLAIRGVDPVRQIISFPKRVNETVDADIYLLSGDHERPDRLWWGIWRVKPDGALEPVGGTAFLLAAEVDNIGPDLISDFDPTLVSMSFVTPEKLVVNFAGDSAYLLDMTSGVVTTLFAIGGSSHTFAMSRHGHIALYFRGGGKIYLFKA